MSAEKGPLWARLLIVLFSAAIVGIAGNQISKRYVGKKKSQSPASAQTLLEELKGDVDVAKASMSPEYVEKYAAPHKQKDLDKANADASAGKAPDGNLDTKALGKLFNKIAP